MKRVLALSAILMVVWGMTHDRLGIPQSTDAGGAPDQLRRRVLSQPLVMPQKNSTIDCFFDDLKDDYICYFSEHNYSASNFVARCATKTFNVSTCECELSTKPDKWLLDNKYQKGASQFQPCAMCQLLETSDDGWDVEYNCSNILRGTYASSRNSTAFEEAPADDYVRFEETTVASPFQYNVDPNISVGDPNSGGSHREEPETTREYNSTGSEPTEAPSSRVILTMHKVTRRPSPAPTDWDKEKRKAPGGTVRRRR